MIVTYIDTFRDRFGVEPICAVLAEHGTPIAPSTYWARKAEPYSDAEWDDAHMANIVLDLWRANRSVYGADKLAAAMRKAGHRRGPRPGCPVDEDRRDRRGPAGLTSHGDHPSGSRRGSASRSDQPRLEHTDPPGPVVGRGLHLRVDPGGVRLRELRHPTCARGGSSGGGSRCPKQPRS